MTKINPTTPAIPTATPFKNDAAQENIQLAEETAEVKTEQTPELQYLKVVDNRYGINRIIAADVLKADEFVKAKKEQNKTKGVVFASVMSGATATGVLYGAIAKRSPVYAALYGLGGLVAGGVVTALSALMLKDKLNAQFIDENKNNSISKEIDSHTNVINTEYVTAMPVTIYPVDKNGRRDIEITELEDNIIQTRKFNISEEEAEKFTSEHKADVDKGKKAAMIPIVGGIAGSIIGAALHSKNKFMPSVLGATAGFAAGLGIDFLAFDLKKNSASKQFILDKRQQPQETTAV